MPKKSQNQTSGNLDRGGRNPLHNAVIDQDLETFQMHIKNSEFLNARDHEAWTPLHFAAQNHSLEFCRALVEAGAEINAQDAHGNTPISNAVFSYQTGDSQLIPFLLARGADPSIENAYGISALALARSIGNTDVEKFFKDW